MRFKSLKVVLSPSTSMNHVQLFVRHWMESGPALGFLAYLLVVVPIVGMDLVHKYGWEHWEPFDK